MRLTTKGRFAVTAMVDLALSQTAGPVTLAEISARQAISLSYLEQLFAKLRRNHLVDAIRGPGGGYSLARPSTEVSVADIILAVDEPLDATRCGGKENCQALHDPIEKNPKNKSVAGRCMTHDLWATLNFKMVEYLESVSLKDLMDHHQAKRQVFNPVIWDERLYKNGAVELAQVKMSREKNRVEELSKTFKLTGV